MCRLFGCRSRERSGVTHELLHGANALRIQSMKHPDGWGVGWYDEGEPHVVRSLSAAHGDGEFERIASFVEARTIVAHVRQASVGGVGEHNTHPFRRGKWLFAHNGTLPNWETARAKLEAHIDPALRARLRGETDSERCFLVFLSALGGRTGLSGAEAALREAVRVARDAAGPDSSTTFVATDGRLLVACRAGRTLHLALGPQDARGAREYVAVASEDPGEGPPGGRKWTLLPEGALVAVDEEMRFAQTTL